MSYDPREQDEIVRELLPLIRAVLADGGRKRAAGRKPHWKRDVHIPSMYRHLHRWESGEMEDPDSGVHPLAHLAVRALMIAWQETHR